MTCQAHTTSLFDWFHPCFLSLSQAPEVYNQGSYRYTDVFAFGMVLYELLSGLSFYDEFAGLPRGKRKAEIIKAVKEGRRPGLHLVPEQYRDLIGRCWQHGWFALIAI
jgi:hypothetical protein